MSFYQCFVTVLSQQISFSPTRDCPQIDPDYKKKNQHSDKKGRLAMIRSGQPNLKTKPLFCGTAQRSASTSNTQGQQTIVQLILL